MPKPTFALSEQDVRAETKALQEAWAALQPLDSEARSRVLSWLQAWASAERPGGRESEF